MKNQHKKTSMKKRDYNLLRFILLFLMIQSVASMQAQIRVGGSTTPSSNAILDLNANDTANGSMGLLLPRVALVSTTNASPLMAHVRGMFVYNTATANDVLPGVYHNDGVKWIRGGNHSETTTLNLRQLEITIDEPISTQSVIYYGEITAVQSPDLKVLNIEPVFSDEMMPLTLFSVSSSAKPDEMGTTVKWSVKVSNANIDSSKSCTLEKVVITYMCDWKLNTGSLTGTYILVGQ